MTMISKCHFKLIEIQICTCSHVIMVLVDVANGKPKHVPYRDSRLTFLLQVNSNFKSFTFFLFLFFGFLHFLLTWVLEYNIIFKWNTMQDSLGGNSKTMIIANVSPSIWLVNLFFQSFQFATLHSHHHKILNNSSLTRSKYNSAAVLLKHWTV